jgi:hypothetical protein
MWLAKRGKKKAEKKTETETKAEPAEGGTKA